MQGISTQQELLSEANDMQAYLELVIPSEAADLKERATILSVYLARSGKMLADAKNYLYAKQSSEVMEILRTQLKQTGTPMKAINALVDSCSREERFLVDWIERIHRTTVHQIDMIRTLISYDKEVMRMSPMQR